MSQSMSSSQTVTCLFILLLISNSLFAQNPQARQGRGNWNGGANGQANIGRFYGKVVDETSGEPIAYASVQLRGMQYDSTAGKMVQANIAGQLTEPNGDFSLENLPVRGAFTLKISFLGYVEMEQKVSFMSRGSGGNPSFDKDLGNIKLAASSSLLKEVTISGDASQVSLALDKKIYKVDKDDVAAGGTAEDALKNIPTLQVDIDGNLTMRNASPQIFVDGRPTNLTLDQIPSDAIDNVEVITNPSAKYDASGGSAGIVNIVLKKERRIGYNGSIRAGIDMRGRANLGGNINAREGKFNAFVGLYLNQRKSYSSAGTIRNTHDLDGTPTSLVDQHNAPISSGLFAMVRGGLDWFIDNRNTLTFSGNYHGGSFNNMDQLFKDETFYSDSLSDNTISSIRNSESTRNFKNLGTQVLFKHLFPKDGKEWTADINYNQSRSENNADYLTEFIGTGDDSSERQLGDGGNSYLTVQSDFVNPITKSLKFETGVRLAVRNFDTDNQNFVFDSLQNDYLYVPGFTDKYKFNDQVYAAYGSVSHSFQRWGYQLGLRAESSKYSGTLIDRDTTFTNDFPISLFPSAFLTYKLNEEDNIQLSYTRRINRPNFFQLIPFTDFSDSLDLSRGNPDLLPEFANSMEVSYQNIINKNHNFLTSVYYKRSKNLITSFTTSEFNEDLQRIIGIRTYQNANSSYAYGMEFTIKNTFLKIVSLTSNVNFYNSVLELSSEGSQITKAEQFTWFLKENLNVKLPGSFTVQFNGSYRSRTSFDTGGGGGRHGWRGNTSNTAQGYSIPVWYVDASLRKDLWKRTASLSLSIQDIFRSRKTGSFTESELFTQESWRRRDAQLVRLTFSYRFGKFDVSLFKRKNNNTESSGSEMEGDF
ncbi:MAG: TonB-dependent receptor [Lewinellaceae bacterium]|nr:TonB-dependent receptor [Saprospiraceae bacterium]MCB9342579.1 TonB-dependent receptor [Lewinellaceae bacterium]